MAEIDVKYLQLVTQHQAAIHGYIRSIAPGANIDDILQETNIILWEKANTFKAGTNFKSFALRIAHFKTLEALRAAKRRNWLIFDSDILDTIAESAENVNEEEELSQEALRSCVSRLSTEDRTLIHSRYTHRQSLRQIAESLNRSEGALQQVFFRIRNTLRECILRTLSEGLDSK